MEQHSTKIGLKRNAMNHKSIEINFDYKSKNNI